MFTSVGQNVHPCVPENLIFHYRKVKVIRKWLSSNGVENILISGREKDSEVGVGGAEGAEGGMLTYMYMHYYTIQ